MKNLNLTTTTNQTGTNENASDVNDKRFEFNDVVVYQEMADQPAVRLNLVQQIHAQMNQLDEMIGRKQFVLKEIYHEIVKS